MTVFDNGIYTRLSQEWLDLSIQKSIPISLLIMSRAFNIAAVDAESSGKRQRLDKQPPDTSMESLTSSMSSMDPDIINEVPNATWFFLF